MRYQVQFAILFFIVAFYSIAEARYYDPIEGRFISKDPAGFSAGDVNLYAYTFNNPLRFTDPYGLAVYMCSRPTDFELFGHHFSVGNHFWLKTDTAEAGMGRTPGNVPGQGNSDFPGAPVQVVNHKNESQKNNATCAPVDEIDEACVNRLLQEGRNLGRWLPTNQCQSFALQVLSECSKASGPRK